MNRLSFSVAFVLAASWSLPAFAEDAPADEAPRPVTITYTLPAVQAPPAADKPAEITARPRYDLWRISVGPRFDYVTSAGFDTFAKDDLLANLSLDATYPLFARGKIALGVGAGWTVSGRSDGVRGADTSVKIHRFQVPIEARYHVVPQVFAFAKVAPGAAAMLAEVKEASSPNALSDTAWAFSADASVGAGILLGPRSYTAEGGTGADADREKRTIRIWAIPEVGYGFTTKGRFELRPDRDAKDALGTDERTALRSLSLSAFFWRVSVATTF